jgi:hypothetical protein
VGAPAVPAGATGAAAPAGPARVTGLDLVRGGPVPLPPDWSAGGASGSYGQPYAVEPSFTLGAAGLPKGGGDAPRADGVCGAGNVSVLGRLREGRLPSLVQLDGSRCRLLFSSSPGLSADLYQRLAADAGVHIYTNATDVTLEAAGNALLLHCGRGGEPCRDVHVRLPAPASTVTLDDFSDDAPPGRLLCTSCDGFVVTMVVAASPVLVWVEFADATETPAWVVSGWSVKVRPGGVGAGAQRIMPPGR